MRNLFLEKSYPKCGEEASPRQFYKNQKWISTSVVWNVKSFFIACSSRSLPKYTKIKMLPTGFYLNKAFLKCKKRSGTSLPASFSAWFEEKYFTCYILLTDWYFIAWLPLLLYVLDNLCSFFNYLNSSLLRHKFLQLTLTYLSGRFLHNQNLEAKM